MADESIPHMNADCANTVRLLREGGVVALPTETVYGLGADASNPQAVARVFALKGRPADHPLIVHIGSVDKLDQWAWDIPVSAYELAAKFWPGPLTMILKRAPWVLDAVTGGQDTIGLRVPNHPLTLQVLAEFAGGVAAPSANRFGKISPTCASHVFDEFADQLDYILDGGPCSVGLESTIVDLTGSMPRVLRVGAIPLAGILAVTGEDRASSPQPAQPRTPGSHLKHYAPDTPLCLATADEMIVRIRLAVTKGRRVGVIARMITPKEQIPDVHRWVSMPRDAEGFGRVLYATLRDLDVSGCEVMIVESPPATQEWEAVIDRLTRAASGACVEQENSGT